VSGDEERARGVAGLLRQLWLGLSAYRLFPGSPDRPGRSLRFRLVSGAIVLALGVAPLAYGLFGRPADALQFVGIGVALTFIGVAMLTPLIARPVAAGIGLPIRRTGVPGKLGRENSMRNPRRTAATASALMIGLGLVVFVAVFGASAKASTTVVLERTLKADFILTSPTFSGFSTSAAEDVRAVPGVETVSQVRQAEAKVEGGTVFVTGLDPATFDDVSELGVVEGSVADLGAQDTIAIHEDIAATEGWGIGDTIDVEWPSTGRGDLEIAVIYAENGLIGDWATSLDTYDANVAQELDLFVLVKAGEGASVAAVRSDLEDALEPYPNIEVQDQAEFREMYATFLNQVLNLVTALLLFAGATGKSAQLPLHVWLPDAMEGPTPVSALIHAATMVTAGVFLIARLDRLFLSAPAALFIVAIVGALTAFYAATVALRQFDLKRVLAYSTISQLGYMFVAMGALAPVAGIFHLVTHAFFKALLFLAAGSVMHAMHDVIDMRRLGGLARPLRWTFGGFVIGALAIAGIPPFAGFFSKDLILEHAFVLGLQTGNYIPYVLGLLTAFVTAVYMTRAAILTFLGTPGASDAHPHESPPIMLLPMAALAALSLAGIGPEKTRIRIYASPEAELNRHRITVEGEFGRLSLEIENVPSENPRTGKLSYLSTIALLRDLGATLRIGT